MTVVHGRTQVFEQILRAADTTGFTDVDEYQIVIEYHRNVARLVETIIKIIALMMKILCHGAPELPLPTRSGRR
ncbi:MAG: hypothetical protein KTR32_11530 [Granulosicoccus sp.]|nr:hypothetical protein [Granulosicoccus sp.]